jgi:hypothetical protein
MEWFRYVIFDTDCNQLAVSHGWYEQNQSVGAPDDQESKPHEQDDPPAPKGPDTSDDGSTEQSRLMPRVVGSDDCLGRKCQGIHGTLWDDVVSRPDLKGRY